MKHLLRLLFLLPSAVWAQIGNWVENGSFEDHLSLPRRIEALGVLTSVEAWYQPTGGSADYYHSGAGRECGVPDNKLGCQPAYDGQAYCGIYCSKDEYREYLQTQLKQPLVAGRSYRLTFYVSLSENSSVAIATMGGLLTADRVGDTSRGILMRRTVGYVAPDVRQTVSSYYRPQVQNEVTSRLDDTQHWQRVAGEFVADGGERFLTLGNFCAAAHSNPGVSDRLTGLLTGAYYYIDSVTLRCLDCDTADSCAAEPDPVPYSVGDSIILNDLFFEFDKSVLLQQSYHTLKQLLDLLDRHPAMRIEVQGHTDNRGAPAYNQRLSERRAKAVVDYLVGKGISPRRLQYKGYGDSRPVADNHTDEGRSRNRRVMFIIRDL